MVTDCDNSRQKCSDYTLQSGDDSHYHIQKWRWPVTTITYKVTPMIISRALFKAGSEAHGPEQLVPSYVLCIEHTYGTTFPQLIYANKPRNTLYYNPMQ